MSVRLSHLLTVELGHAVNLAVLLTLVTVHLIGIQEHAKFHGHSIYFSLYQFRQLLVFLMSLLLDLIKDNEAFKAVPHCRRCDKAKRILTNQTFISRAKRLNVSCYFRLLSQVVLMNNALAAVTVKEDADLAFLRNKPKTQPEAYRLM